VNHSTEIQIKECEEQLKEAMLHSDIDALDKLLADNLTFTNHLGHLMTKQDDIEAHKSKILKISEITISILDINLHKGVAITTVQAYIIGSFNNEVSKNNFHFTRAWKKNSNNLWQVIAGHSSIVD